MRACVRARAWVFLRSFSLGHCEQQPVFSSLSLFCHQSPPQSPKLNSVVVLFCPNVCLYVRTVPVDTKEGVVCGPVLRQWSSLNMYVCASVTTIYFFVCARVCVCVRARVHVYTCVVPRSGFCVRSAVCWWTVTSILGQVLPHLQRVPVDGVNSTGTQATLSGQRRKGPVMDIGTPLEVC